MPIPEIRVFNKGPRGAANLAIFPDKVEVTFDRDGSMHSFSRSDADALGFDPSIVPEGRVHATVSGDKKKLWGVRPMEGSFFAKVDSFAHSEDTLPTPKRYEGIGRKKNGETFPYNYEAFDVLVRIQNGDWTDTIIPSQLRYLFTDAGDGESAGIRTGGKHAQVLANFLENAGLDFDVDTIPLSDNVLPWLEAELTSRDEQFMIIVDNGYIQSFAPSP